MDTSVLLGGLFVLGLVVGAVNAAARTWQGMPFVFGMLGAWFWFLWTTQTGGITDREGELLGATLACGMTGYLVGGVLLPPARRRPRNRRPARPADPRPVRPRPSVG